MTHHANITVTMTHESGRTETIPNTISATTENGSIIVTYTQPGVNPDEIYSDSYDALAWEISSTRHTEAITVQ